METRTKRYLAFLAFDNLYSKYKLRLSKKEKEAIFEEVYKEIIGKVRGWGESNVDSQVRLFHDVVETWGDDVRKHIMGLIKTAFKAVEKAYKERKVEIEEGKEEPKAIQAKELKGYKCPITDEKGGVCGGKIFEYVYDEGKIYRCEKSKEKDKGHHFWTSLDDLRSEIEELTEKRFAEGITPPEVPPGGLAEFEALFKKKGDWDELSIEEKKSYVSKFLAHPALENHIKKLQKKGGWKLAKKIPLLKKIPAPWWASSKYYEEANELTGFEDRKKELKEGKKEVFKKLKDDYGKLRWFKPKWWAEKNIKNGELRDKYFAGGGFGSEEEDFLRGRLIGGVNRLAGRHSEHVRGVMPAIIIFGLGAVISIILGSLMFFFAFFSIGLQQLMPPAKEKLDAKGEKTGEWENLGTAYLRSIFKCTAIVLFALGIGQTNLPFANIFLMIVALGGYAAMKVTYEAKRPDQLVESFIRFGFLGVLVIPWFIFAQIFGSMTLGLMALVFFAVPPIKVGGETEKIERTFAYQIWKPIFLVVMLIVLVSSGALGTILPFLSLGWELTGSLGYIFIYIWFVSFLAGIFTSPESLPSIGMIVLIVTTIIFGLGPGTQNVGIALFGQWWPTVHNTVNEFMEPIGDMFAQLSQTFGQTLFMISNPMGFAQQITEGTYVQNPTGPTGAYGLEIDNLEVDSIYVGEPFSIRFELSNKGSFDADNVSLEIWSGVETFNYLRDETEISKKIDLNRFGKSEKINYIDWYKYIYVTPPFWNEPIIKQDIKPRFLFGEVDCEGQAKIKQVLGVTTAGGANLRDKFIPFRVNIKYNYEVYSNLQVEILSQQEWDSRVRNGLLQRGQKLSRVSTAPAKLSIGAMDQPIREGLPMFVGFNLSSAEGRDSKVGHAFVRLEFPAGFIPLISEMKCTEKKKPLRDVSKNEDKVTLEWELEEDEPKHVFCFFPAPEMGDIPSKTFTISASGEYTFERWEREDTLINFLDACEESRGEETGSVPDETTPSEPSAGTMSNPYTSVNLMVDGKRWNDATAEERSLWINENEGKYYYFKVVIENFRIIGIDGFYVFDPEKKLGYEIADTLYQVKSSNGEAVCIYGKVLWKGLDVTSKYTCPS